MGLLQLECSQSITAVARNAMGSPSLRWRVHMFLPTTLPECVFSFISWPSFYCGGMMSNEIDNPSAV